MHVARICRAKYPDLDGKGAAKSGGRWNSIGTPIVYASSCGALAVLEYRVHTHVNPDDLLIYTIEIPDALHVEKLTWMPDTNFASHRRHLGQNQKIADPIGAVRRCAASGELLDQP